MRLTYIKTKNHKVLGDFDLSLLNEDGKATDTIILAGENGSGKSILLSLIFSLSHFNLSNDKREESRQFQIQLTDEEIETICKNDDLLKSFKDGVADNLVTINYDFSKINDWNQITVNFKNKSGAPITVTANRFINAPKSNVFRIAFSDVEINFTPGNISSVTSKDVDQEITNSIKSSNNLATEITQLLIDVTNLDALDFTNWGRENQEKQIDGKMLDARMKRFKRAFSYMFPKKEFYKVENISNKKAVLFKEGSKIIPIENLSSGEKQIVFRGGFLLKDINSLKGALILIDEPEISLHPRWQLRILEFFKKLFTDENGRQTSQVIIATHSPFIIHNSNRYDDKVVVLEKDDTGNIKIIQNGEFFGWTNEIAIEKAFRIEGIKGLEKDVIFVEGETDEKYLVQTLKLFKKSDLIEVKWIGRITENGQREFTGDSALDQTKAFFLANKGFLKCKVILLYDNDCNVKNGDYEKIYVRKAPKNNENGLYKIGIENLLTLPDNFEKDQFYRTTTVTGNYGEQKIIQELDKNKLCQWVLGLDESEQIKILDKLSNVIDELLKVGVK